MSYNSIPFKRRINENIKNYKLKQLFSINQMKDYIFSLAETLHLNILVTERHGETFILAGDCAGFVPDVVKNPGYKIKVNERTVGHFYIVRDGKEDQSQHPHGLIEQVVLQLGIMAEETYHKKELAIHLDELEEQIEKEYFQVKYGDKEDALTGVLNKTSFENRLRIMDRLEIAPAAVVCGNINDWKYVNDHFGEEESDRLIQVIAGIMKEEAASNYVIGRVDGDVINVIIPITNWGEGEDYCARVQNRCLEFADEKISPSIAFGVVQKTNVEEHLLDLFSDAEYEMFQNKMVLKSAPGYQERLEKFFKK